MVLVLRNQLVTFCGLVAALNFPAATAVAPAPQTRCDHAQLGRELDGDAVPGVPLIAGLQTGMSRGEVNRVAPRLSDYEARQKLDLFPGLELPATAQFKRNKWSGPLDFIALSGPSAKSPADALTQHFGAPIRIDAGIINTQNPGMNMPAQNNPVMSNRYTVRKWCDSQRVFILNMDEERFTLTVSGPRTKR